MAKTTTRKTTLDIVRSSRTLAAAHWRLILVVALSLPLIFFHLGRGSLVGDEATYGSVAQSILLTHNPITMHWGAHAWFEKPPLYLWLTAITFKLLGVSALTARLMAALSGVGVIVLTYLIGVELADETTGLIAALITITTAPLLFVARFGNLDAMLTFWIYLAIWAYLRTAADQAYWVLAASASAAAILAKGAAGLFAPIILLLLMLIERRRLARPARRTVWASLLAAAVIILPWHLTELITNGRAFLSSYVGYHVLRRAASPIEGHTGGPLFYFKVLATTYLPWIILVPVALAQIIWRRWWTRRQTYLPLLVTVVVLLVTLLMQTKQNWYIMPLYPSLAVLIAGLIVSLTAKLPRRLLAGGAAAALVIGVAAIILIPTLHTKAHRFAGDVYNKPVQPIAQLSADAAASCTYQHQPLALYAGSVASESNPSTVLFYAQRNVQFTNSAAALQRYLRTAPHHATDLIAPTNRLLLLQSTFNIKPIATAGPLSYLTIASQ